jgi:hypothetical protein
MLTEIYHDIVVLTAGLRQHEPVEVGKEGNLRYQFIFLLT